mmetsp:Transcript_25477/g.83865  ORF Transcript_25477/g.83865 Transcript_25477/m.83865 type:complete len:409 (+) Transcript_25477:2272-3498(+)
MRPLGVECNQRMAAFVVRCELPVLLRDDCRLALRPHHDAVLGVFEVRVRHLLGALHRRLECRDVDEVGELSAAEARRAACNHLEVNAGRERDTFAVLRENLCTPRNVRVGHDDRAVEAARAYERLVERLGKVGGGDADDSLVLLEAVELHEHLVERHLHVVLVLRVALPTDSVHLVDEDDARRVLLGRLEEVPHAARPNPDKHLLKLAPGAVEEGNASLACDGTCEHRLARAGRPHQQHPFRELPAEPSEALRVPKVRHNLLELAFRLVHTFDIGELGVRLNHRLDRVTRTPQNGISHSPALLHHHGNRRQHEQRPAQQSQAAPELRREAWLHLSRVHRRLGRPQRPDLASPQQSGPSSGAAPTPHARRHLRAHTKRPQQRSLAQPVALHQSLHILRERLLRVRTGIL